MNFERHITYNLKKNITDVIYTSTEGHMYGTIVEGDVRRDEAFLNRLLLEAEGSYEKRRKGDG